MKVVIVAGGIGSGKSTAATVLTSLGLPVCDADDMARLVTGADGECLDTLVASFGKGILGDDGTLDRAFVASMVFNDDDALRRLNAITHPAIEKRLEEFLEQESMKGSVVAFVLVPLLSPGIIEFLKADETWTIDVAPDIACSRVVAGRGFSKADVEARMNSQLSNEERRKMADVVISNNDGVAEFEQTIRALVDARDWS
jgi:dephospho-CoA kinase